MKTTAFLATLALSLVGEANAVQVILPDNGFGTVNMPPAAAYVGNGPMQIINGLPFGSTIDITASIPSPLAAYEEAGGSFPGGTRAGYGGNLFQWSMQGTGLFIGYTRNITFPITPFSSVLSFPPTPANFFDPTGAQIEFHYDARTPGAPVQAFSSDLFRGFSQITGDPDFDLLRVVMGTDFGLPSPGLTTLTDLGGGNWNVDSFFDITYRIDFVGTPGGPFAGMSGSTTGTERFQLGEPVVPEPSAALLILLATPLVLSRRRLA